MDKIFKKKCEKESIDFSDCIYNKHYNVGMWSLYTCVNFLDLYDKCIMMNKKKYKDINKK